jgi:hypothetical protein
MGEEIRERRAPLHVSVITILAATLAFWTVVGLFVSRWL